MVQEVTDIQEKEVKTLRIIFKTLRSVSINRSFAGLKKYDFYFLKCDIRHKNIAKRTNFA